MQEIGDSIGWRKGRLRTANLPEVDSDRITPAPATKSEIASIVTIIMRLGKFGRS